MAKGRTDGKNQDGDQLRLELVGLQAGGERPKLVVQALDEKQRVLLAQQPGPDGVFKMPQEVLKRAARVVIGADDDAGGVKAEGAIGYRASEFAAQIRNGTLALAEGVWSRLLYRWVCVSGSVRVCRRRPRWFEQVFVAATEAVARASQPVARASHRWRSPAPGKPQACRSANGSRRRSTISSSSLSSAAIRCASARSRSTGAPAAAGRSSSTTCASTT
jgi:hypothetical protein